jgi:hypothetical protein
MRIIAILRDKLTVINIYFTRAWVSWASKYSVLISTATLLYFNVQILQSIFVDFIWFLIIVSIVFITILSAFGWLDMTRFGTFTEEKKVLVSKKHYFYEPHPKEKEVKYYTPLVLAREVKKIANSLKIDTRELDEIIDRTAYFIRESDSKVLNNIFRNYFK